MQDNIRYHQASIVHRLYIQVYKQSYLTANPSTCHAHSPTLKHPSKQYCLDLHQILNEITNFLLGMYILRCQDFRLSQQNSLSILQKPTHLKYFKTSHIQNANKRCSLSFCTIKRAVDAVHQPPEHTFITSFRNSLHCKLNLFFCLGLGNKVTTNFDARPKECLGHLCHTQTQKMSNLLCHGVVWQYGLVRVTLLFELHISKQQHC